ncbi:MAG TPA: GNAT family N-acetyltransferase [Jatrophihabitans sp.]|nr:GNAT family N-acetyltransferase [Jatrophihabitans sp.]
MEQGGDRLELRVARPTDLDPVTFYEILRLRVDVFVVEQACPYPELDGRDLDPTTRWVWASAGDQIVGTLRILTETETEDGPARIGRVATAASARSSGIAGRMLAFALDQIAGRAVVLDAQSYLEGWYQRFGFARSGAEFVEDGIPHVPMHRKAQPGTAGSGVLR